MSGGGCPQVLLGGAADPGGGRLPPLGRLLSRCTPRTRCSSARPVATGGAGHGGGLRRSPGRYRGRPLRRPRRRRAGAHTALRHPRQNRRAQRTGQGKRDCTRGRAPLFVAERGGALLSCLGPGPLPPGGGCDRRRRRRRVPGRGCAPAGRRDAGGGRGRHYWCGGRRRW